MTIIAWGTITFQTSYSDFMSRNRSQPLALYRQILMYLTYRDTGLSTSKIGKIFADRDHATVLHAHKKVEELIKSGEQTVIYYIQRYNEYFTKISPKTSCRKPQLAT